MQGRKAYFKHFRTAQPLKHVARNGWQRRGARVACKCAPLPTLKKQHRALVTCLRVRRCTLGARASASPILSFQLSFRALSVLYPLPRSTSKWQKKKRKINGRTNSVRCSRGAVLRISVSQMARFRRRQTFSCSYAIWTLKKTAKVRTSAGTRYWGMTEKLSVTRTFLLQNAS